MWNNKKLLNYFFSIFLTILLAVIWVKAWDWLISTNWDSLDYQKWNSLIWINPTWMPSWWTRFNDADRRVIIWASDTTSPADASTWKPALPSRSFRSLWWNEYPPVDTNTLSVDIKFIWSTTTTGSNTPSDTTTFLWWNTGWSNMFSAYLSDSPFSLSWTVLTNTQRDWAAKDNMQPYIALVYCKKN